MRKKVLDKVHEFGGEFEEWGSRTELMGTASLPKGLNWKATSCHSIAINFYTDRPAGWKALWRDVSEGVYPCDIKDCEICAGY